MDNEIYAEYFAESSSGNWQLISENEIADAKELMATQGMDFVKSFMESKLESWKSQPLHCGITGSAGTGKFKFH